MDLEKLAEFPFAPIESLLENCYFGRLLSAGKTTGVLEFRGRCRELLDRLVFIILSIPAVSSRVTRGFSCFCPENMLEGDDHAVFRLFADLTGVLGSCVLLAADEAKAAVEQFNSYIVEKRRQHHRSNTTASEISNVVHYFQARHHVCRVLKLCCLIMGGSCGVHPQVTFDLGGGEINEDVFRNCLRLVQSYVFSPGYCPQLFLTESTLGAVRDAIASAGIIFVTPGYNVWKDVCDSGMASFISRSRKIYDTSLLERRKYYEYHYVDCNKANCLSRVNAAIPAGDAGSTSSLYSKSSRATPKSRDLGKNLRRPPASQLVLVLAVRKGRKRSLQKILIRTCSIV